MSVAAATAAPLDDDALVKAWTAAYSDEVLSFSRPEEVSNEEVFADVYHSLIHSAGLSHTLIQLEHGHAAAVGEKCAERNREMDDIDRRQNREMQEAVEAAANKDDDGASEQVINRLAGQHMEELQMAQLRWDEELGDLRGTQHREFREWVMCVHEELKTSGGGESGAIGGPGVPRSESAFSISMSSALPSLQESFTITLGAQMKQMHNLRLVAADVLDLCKYPPSSDDALPQRLQTSMSLYSNNLCGLVLLTDDRVSTYSGIAKEFTELCQRSTEYHFPSCDMQIQSVKEENLSNALSWRAEHRRRKAVEEESLGIDNPGGGQPATDYAALSNSSLRNGDFYVTKHSNLCEIHAVFHMVTDDSVMSSQINSRHPVVMGLRNVLKTASLNDVTTLTIPLLLTHEMSEEMTVAWCMKRAELVFKCVKGFMMEVSSWGGSELKTLQFLVPKAIDTEVFERLTTMLAGIFRTSNPIRGK